MSEQFNYGKITEFGENGSVFYFMLYIQPKDLSTGAMDHHSKFEVIKTDKLDKEFVANIIVKIQVYGSIDHWMQDLESGDDLPFFFRQMIL